MPFRRSQGGRGRGKKTGKGGGGEGKEGGKGGGGGSRGKKAGKGGGGRAGERRQEGVSLSVYSRKMKLQEQAIHRSIHSEKRKPVRSLGL